MSLQGKHNPAIRRVMYANTQKQKVIRESIKRGDLTKERRVQFKLSPKTNANRLMEDSIPLLTDTCMTASSQRTHSDTRKQTAEPWLPETQTLTICDQPLTSS